ncbi:uncharacterized protein TNCV_3724501 [Trichonephila clavipes]|nr:uncharacterized protein TNCV_3724501 [Trichonephila clavipes]
MSGRPPEELAVELDSVFLSNCAKKDGKSISVETLVDALIVLYDECCNSSLRREKTVSSFIEYACACASSSNAKELDEQVQAHPGIHNKVFDGDRFNSCQVIYSQFGLAIHQNDHQARRRFVEWTQNEIAVVPDFHKRILFSDEAHFWLNGYVNKQNCRIWSEANPQVYVETPLHPEKLTVWCALWDGGILLQKR